METPSKKVALVTGANKGLGFEIARQIGRTGVTVLLGARNKAAGEAAATAFTAEGIDARFLAIDVADYASIEAAASAITTGVGRLDILVNNAGINDPSDGPVPTARLDAVERVLRTNFLGRWRSRRRCFRCCANQGVRVSSMCRAGAALLL
jgi:NAD(P)-dependent dehydrogenase (short-subunit alcohol dehydrogenase family)